MGLGHPIMSLPIAKHTLTLTPTRTRTRTRTIKLTLFHTHIHSLTHTQTHYHSLSLTHTHTHTHTHTRTLTHTRCKTSCDMGWLRLVGSLKLYVSFAKEPYKRNDILQKRPIILRSLLTVATP